MKQVYTKPVLMVETFTLTQTIATKCGAAHDSTLGTPTHYSKSTCGWDMGGNVVIWTTEVSSCVIKEDKDIMINGVCYNNPDGNSSIFGS